MDPNKAMDLHGAAADGESSALVLGMGLGELSLSDSPLKCVDVTGKEIDMSHATVMKIPYLNTLLLGMFSRIPTNENGAKLLPAPIRVNYLKPIISFVEKEDPLYLISKLAKGDSLLEVTQLMDFLCVPVPEIASLDVIGSGLKDDTKDYNERVCRKTYVFHSAAHGRRGARSYAAIFCLGILLDKFDISNPRVRSVIYNLSLYVESHHWTFKGRCRFHLWGLIKEKCTWFTSKQWNSIEKWRSNESLSETDVSLSDRDCDLASYFSDYDDEACCYSSD